MMSEQSKHVAERILWGLKRWDRFVINLDHGAVADSRRFVAVDVVEPLEWSDHEQHVTDITRWVDQLPEEASRYAYITGEYQRYRIQSAILVDV